MPSGTVRIVVGAGILMAGGAALALFGRGGREERAVPVPEAFQLENMQAKMDRPGEMKKLFGSAEYQQLTKAQQAQVIKNKGEAFERMWDVRMDSYFEADEAERVAILDEHLDEMAADMRRAKRGSNAEAKEKATVEMAKKNKKAYGEWSRQERKAKSESVNPDKLARTIAYKHAIQQRADARGLNLWGGKK